MKVIVIGGVATGMSAASKLKRLMQDVTIDVYEKGSDVSYGACGMPYFLSDIIPEASALIARSVAQFEHTGIRVHLNHEVINVDTNKRRIKALNHETNQTIEAFYDRLIIATGAHAIRLNVPGKTLKGLHVLNSLQDAIGLKKALENAQKVTVIGSGFIGLEVVENLLELNKEVTLIERESQIMPIFDLSMVETVYQALLKRGVTIRLNETVTAYQGTESVQTVKTDKASYDTDLVIEAIGVKPNTAFLKDTGISMLPNGAILTNHRMQTSIDNVYAGGDCASYHHIIKNESAYIPLGTHANKAGRVIAEDIASLNTEFQGVQGSSVLKVLDYTLAKTGLTEKEAIANNIAYDLVDVTANNQAGYYPGAEKIQMRIVYDPNNCRLLGAQMLGKKGVSSRINVIAVAINQGMSASDFSKLDLAYAPPFSPVWDPLQVATNQIDCTKGEKQ